METTSDGDVFLVWPTQFARRYAIEQSTDLAQWESLPDTVMGTGGEQRKYLFSITPPPPGVPGPWEPPAPDTVRQHFSLSFFPTGQTLISWTQGGNQHRALVNDDWSTVTVGDQPLPFPALMWYTDANSSPPVNFDFFTWNLQWQPLYASLVPSALPQEAQDRLVLLLGNKEAIMNHAAAVISQSLNHPPDPPLPPGANQRRFIRIVETRPDSDADGLFDDEEMRDYLTDPWLWDSDDDGYTDLDEINAGSDPADAGSKPGSSPDPNAPAEVFVESRTRQLASRVFAFAYPDQPQFTRFTGSYKRRRAATGSWDFPEVTLHQYLTAPGTTEELLPYAWGSFQREPHILTSHHWYWLIQGPEYILPWPLPSASEAQEKAHQEITQIRLRLTKAAEHPISRTYLKILREAPFTDPEGSAADPESPLPTTIPEEAWSITSAETVTLTVPAGSTVSNAAESQETVVNKKAKVQEQVPAEFAQPKLDDNGVPLKNPDGSHILEPVTALRLCRWHSAFGWRVQQGDPPNNAFSAFNQGFYSSDPDRFHIRVIGKDPGNKVKIATSGLNEIKVWQNGAWVEVGSDAEDEITMTKPDPAKDEWISAPLLLLDGDDDATYNPGPDDNQPEDKTHAAGLDATVAVTFPAVKDVQVKATTEKAAFRVRMKVFFLEEFEDSKRQQWANATQFARDVYRPHRLEFEFENPNLLSGSAIEAMLINEDGRKKLDLSTDAKLNDFGAAMVAAGATTDSLTVLLLPLVTGIKTSLIAGHHAVGVTWSYIWNDNGTQKIQYWVALAMFDYRPSVLAHEVGHALGLKHLTKWDSAHLLMAGTAPLPGELTRGPETMPKRLYFDPQNAADMESNESARILWNAKTLPFCQKR